MMHRAPGIFGTVQSMSGTTLTVLSEPLKHPGASATQTPTTYTVDASSATVLKNGTVATLGDIAVNDTVMVQGIVSGTSVVAKNIRDGLVPQRDGFGPKAPMIQGNGEPLIGGSVSTVSGATLSVATKAGPTYSVDVSGATIAKRGASSTVADIAIGDRVLVQGTVNGASVTASSVIDQGAAPAAPSSTSTRPAAGRGFFGFLGGFFHTLFGFF